MPDKIVHPAHDNKPTQGAFLLRYWQEYEGSPYRFMLKSVSTNEREMFSDIPSLLMRLQMLLDVEGND